MKETVWLLEVREPDYHLGDPAQNPHAATEASRARE